MNQTALLEYVLVPSLHFLLPGSPNIKKVKIDQLFFGSNRIKMDPSLCKKLDF